MKRFETPSISRRQLPLTSELRDFLRRRTMPFMDQIGVERPLAFVLEEVYLQGMRDAVQAMTERSDADVAA